MVSPHHVVKIVTALSAVALAASVAVTPAYALQDIAIEDAVAQSGSVTADNGAVMQSDDQSDDQTGDQQSQDGMPDNPNAKLPDTVSDEISDDATVVSEDLAVTPEGKVKNIETGEIVADPTLVGTQDQQPDPLAKTNGESFIPVSAEDVKNAVADANDANSAEVQSEQSSVIVEQSSMKSSAQSTQSNAKVQTTKFESNEYGAHWGTYNNSKAFFDYQNNMFVQQAKGVIDVSEWQGDIDWAKAKADGVEGVIIRLGYGEGNNADKKAQRNISECKKLGIPFGIYWYSYADTPSLAKEEGADVVAKLKQFGVNPSDLAYPVYYDLEKWTWEGHQPPTDPNVYNNIVNNWYSALQSAGYKNLGVYSYTSYLRGPLKHADIYAKTAWVAQYGARMGFDSFSTNSRGWQYTSSGKVDGISGNVDMNAFGNKEYVNGGSSNSATSYEVKGNMGVEWRSIGAEKSVIGKPIANEVCDWTQGRVNCYQNFENGAISWTPSTGAHYTTGAIRKEWARRNYEHGVLGYPIEDEKKLSNDWKYQRFQNGDIWSRGTKESRIVLYNLRDSFYKNGGYSSLGGPVADEESMGRGWWRQRFQYGDVWSKDGTNYRFVIKFDLRDSWNQHRGFSWLGAPVANEENMGNGYWRQRCENGDVWTRNGASEKYIVMLNLRKEYYAKGGFSKLGGPVSEERNLGSIWRQDFQKGSIYAH
ncbi:GH25 family lysozyme [Bifidobacterium pseudocatenulatum]|uniref:GH25 family lysozyme n=1 Tax=Bifidobacterium pseudocatenulatum TaxID=28026 RepID=UPI0022E34288|nr:GH25 family lysozyme [Bifidobacterium pseudocatenulatum]